MYKNLIKVYNNITLFSNILLIIPLYLCKVLNNRLVVEYLLSEVLLLFLHHSKYTL